MLKPFESATRGRERQTRAPYVAFVGMTRVGKASMKRGEY